MILLSEILIRPPLDGVGSVDVGVPLRLALIVLRAAGFYAALVSFRVAGLLVRDVPEVREVLR